MECAEISDKSTELWRNSPGNSNDIDHLAEENAAVRKEFVEISADFKKHMNNGLNERTEFLMDITSASSDMHSVSKSNDVSQSSLGDTPSKIVSIEEGKSEQNDKLLDIEKFLGEKNVNELRSLACSEGGLIADNARKRAWPLLLGLSPEISPGDLLSESELKMHRYYQQVVMDVNRLLKRFPPGLNDRQQSDLQTKVTRLVVQVLLQHPHLHYYQGFHDVAITLILVLGPELSIPVLSRLTETHLKEFMGLTMEPTMHKLYNVLALIQRVDPQLHKHIIASEVGTMFCLPWVITWFGHVLNDYDIIVRLYDYFLASPPTACLYLSAAIVLYKKDACLASPADLPCMHQILSQVSDDLPFESLLGKASELAIQYPLSCLMPEVNRMIEAEKAEEIEREKRRQKIKAVRTVKKVEQVPSPAWLQIALPFVYLQRPSRWLTLSVGVAVAAVLYSYLRPYDSPEW